MDIKFQGVFSFILVGIVFFLTFLKIHQSSMGAYYSLFSNTKDSSHLLFRPRNIRSDEWLVGTPQIISQVLNNHFNTVTTFIGTKETIPAMIGFPYYHWRAFFHPTYLPYFFLPLENAFALSWWIGPLFMLIGAYLLIKRFTKDPFTAVFCSLIFFFVPFNQWWTNGLTPFLGYGSLAFYCLVQALEEKNRRMILLHSILSVYFFLCFVFILYPPFQVSVGLFFLSFGVGYLFKNRIFSDKDKTKKFIFSCALIAVSTLIAVTSYYLEFKDIISIVQNTAYPGKRFITGGGYSISHLLNGFYNVQLLDDVKGAAGWNNQSEASNFFLFYLFAAPVYLYVLYQQIKRKNIDWIFTLIFFYLMVATAWLFIPFPTLLAKITLLYIVPPNRMLIGIGIADLILTVYFLTNIKIKHKKIYKILTILCSLGAFVVNLYLGFSLNKNYPLFIQSKGKIIMISLIAGGLTYLLLKQKRKLFMILLLLFSVYSTYRVNPISRGLDPILNTQLSRSIQSIESTNKNKSRWVVYDSNIWGQYIIANGARSISGVYHYPQFDLWKTLDPKYLYKNIWNRYAHVYFVNRPQEKNDFILLYEDSFIVNKHPCNVIFRNLNVKYYVMTKESQYACLRKIGQYKTNDGYVYIFERI